MPTKIIGHAPYQVSRNADLGSLAFHDADSVNINDGAITLSRTVNTGYNINTNVSATRPTLNFDFANSRKLDNRLTFFRNSVSLAYDEGTNSKGEENLLRYSTDLTKSTYWNAINNAGITLTTGVIAPDGTPTAYGMVEKAITGFHELLAANYPAPGSSGKAYTLSIFAKAGARNGFSIYYWDNGDYYCNFDLSAGTVGTSSGCTGSIVSFGNGWYRCSITRTSSGGDMRASFECNNYGSYAGVAGQVSTYIWGPQHEQNSYATAYIPTTSSIYTSYIPALIPVAQNQPRFDYDPITRECNGLIVENSRTNLVTYSERYASSIYANQDGLNVWENYSISPDGTKTATKLAQKSGNPTYNYLSVGGQLTASTQYTFSIYAKALEARYITMGSPWSGSVGWVTAQFDLINGVVSATTASGPGYAVNGTQITSVGNGWYRCSITFTTGSGVVANGGSCTITPSLTVYTGYYQNFSTYYAGYQPTGDNYSGILVWGSQIETGVGPTSYIPTKNGATVTRASETALMSVRPIAGDWSQPNDGASWYNYNEGTLYVESKNSLCNSNINNYTGVGVEFGSAQQSNMFALNGGRDSLFYANASLVVFPQAGDYIANGCAPLNYVSSPTTFYKIAGAMKSGNCGVACDGKYSASFSTVFVPPVPIYLHIGANYYAYNGFAGVIKKIAYYPKRLTNDELLEITL